MVNSANIKIVTLSFILLLFSVTVPAADFSVTEFLNETNSVLQWDPYRNSGSIWRGSDVISFTTDSSLAVFNYQEQLQIENISLSTGGELIIPEKTVGILRRYLQERDRNSNQQIVAIFIDAGHGGKDPGANYKVKINGKTVTILEKDIVLQAAKLLSESLSRKYPAKNIVLSRDSDRYVSLDERTRLANSIDVKQGESIIFISLHVNASLNKQARGYEVWYLPPDYRRSNLVDSHTVGVTDRDLLSILNTIKEEEYTIESVLLARNIISGIQRGIGDKSINRGIKQESWYVVRQAKMPSVLVELGFISNQKEAQSLNSPAYLRQLSNGIYNGIVAFISDFES